MALLPAAFFCWLQLFSKQAAPILAAALLALPVAVAAVVLGLESYSRTEKKAPRPGRPGYRCNGSKIRGKSARFWPVAPRLASAETSKSMLDAEGLTQAPGLTSKTGAPELLSTRNLATRFMLAPLSDLIRELADPGLAAGRAGRGPGPRPATDPTRGHQQRGDPADDTRTEPSRGGEGAEARASGPIHPIGKAIQNFIDKWGHAR